MAEGFVRTLAGNRFVPSSAGTESSLVSPLACEVMSEVGIDIGIQHPCSIASLFHETFRYAMALCDEPRERCPVFPFTPNLIRWSIRDPELATGGREVRKQGFRRVRDQIRAKVEELTRTIDNPHSQGRITDQIEL